MSDTSIKKIFIFEFSPFEEENEPEEDKRGFTINFKSQAEFDDFEDWTTGEVTERHDDWSGFLGDMEGYGVHDFGTSGFAEVIGFNSYEIRMPDRNEVMEKWRNFFVKQGYECGPILTGLSYDDHDYAELDLSDTLSTEGQKRYDRLCLMHANINRG